MRCLTAILLSVLLMQGCFIAGKKQAIKEPGKIYTDSEDWPGSEPFDTEPKPDHEDWSKFLSNELQLDSAAVDSIPAGKYTVVAQFTIDTVGKITNISIIKDPGYGLGQRVQKIVSNYKGHWQPARQNGRPTLNYRRQPITFIIEEEEPEGCEVEQTEELIL